MLNMNVYTFCRSESGATTVDMTVLMAGVVGLGLAAVAVVQTEVIGLSGYVDVQLSDMMEDPADTALYSLLNPNRDASWRAVLQERVRRFNDNRLTRGYNNTYTRALTGGRNRRANQIDRLGVFEAEMITRGISIPDDNQRYADLHAAWIAEYG